MPSYTAWHIHAGVVQWQDACFPSMQRGFDSRHPYEVDLFEENVLLGKRSHSKLQCESPLNFMSYARSVSGKQSGSTHFFVESAFFME